MFHTRFVILLAAVLWQMMLIPLPAGAAVSLQVGVPDLKPDIFLRDDGQPGGILGELLGEMAALEGWELRPQACDWSDCLARLAAGRLDVLPDVQATAQRRQQMDFHPTPVFVRSSQIYVPDTALLTQPEHLAGLRIAVLQGSAQAVALQALLARERVDAHLVGVANLEEGFRRVQAQQADAVAADYFYGAQAAPRHGLKATPILFDTSAIFYATPKRHLPVVLDRIDHYLRAWKADDRSVYYQILAQGGQRLPDRPVQRFMHAAAWAALAGGLVWVGLTLHQRKRQRRVRSLFEARTQEADAAQRAQKQLQDQIRRTAYFDTLTELPNRALLSVRAEQAQQRYEEQGVMAAILVLDIDDFRHINDLYGLTIGDQILQAFAERVVSQTQAGDTVARTDGDEFTLLLGNLGTSLIEAEQQAYAFTETLRHSLSAKPLAIQGQPCVFGFSAGIALLGPDLPQMTDCLIKADLAVHRAARLGGNRTFFHNEATQQRVLHRTRLKQDLAAALEHRALSWHIQGQYDADGRVTGAELLARWQHPQHGAISPADFIPMARESGLLGVLSGQLLDTACQLIQALQDRGHRYPISINLSPETLSDATFVRLVHQQMARRTLVPGALVFEITEEATVENLGRVQQHMQTLSALGVCFSMDDFGTGYANLAGLAKLPLYELKIDRTLIQEIPGNTIQASLVQMILMMADRFGLRTVAEGVEQAAQRDFLFQHGCSAVQGYLLGRPVAIAHWLAALEPRDE